MEALRERWRATREAMAGSDAIAEFSGQLEREWAIETGQIENLYDIERGVTQTLIEEGFRASLLERGSTNKPPEYVLSLIEDQRDALEGLFAFVKQDRPLSTSYIKELHGAMTRSQPTTEAFSPTGERMEVPLRRGEWKVAPNYPLRDGKRFLYCPPEQTASEMERLVEMHLAHADAAPEARAAWLHHRFTQIHPFQDGNGRVARALASLVLIQAGMFPMIVPRDEKDTYLDALEAADAEDLRPFLLLIARRQQREYEKAATFFAKYGPDSNNVEEAAQALARSVAHRRAGREFRRTKNIQTLSTQASQSIGEPLSKAIEIVREAQPDARVSYSTTDGSIQAHHDSRHLARIHQALGMDAQSFMPPTPMYVWEVNAPVAWSIRLIVNAPQDDLEETVNVHILVDLDDKLLLLKESTLHFSGSILQSNTVPDLHRWGSGVVIAALDLVRRTS